MRIGSFGLTIILAGCLLSCQKTSRTENVSRLSQDSAIQNIARNVTANAYSQERGFVDGVVKRINTPIEELGAITIKAVDSAEKIFQYSKSKVNIDTAKILNARVRIYWSLQIDTTLDEANSFYMIDSIAMN